MEVVLVRGEGKAKAGLLQVNDDAEMASLASVFPTRFPGHLTSTRGTGSSARSPTAWSSTWMSRPVHSIQFPFLCVRQFASPSHLPFF